MRLRLVVAMPPRLLLVAMPLLTLLVVAMPARAQDAHAVAVGRAAMYVLFEEGVPTGDGDIVDRRWDSTRRWQLIARAGDRTEDAGAVIVIGGRSPCVGTLGPERIVTMWTQYRGAPRTFRARAIHGCPAPGDLVERVAITNARVVTGAPLDRVRHSGRRRTRFRVRGEAELAGELQMSGRDDAICVAGPTTVRLRWADGTARVVTVPDAAQVLFGAWVDGAPWLVLGWSDEHVQVVAFDASPHPVLDVDWPHVVDLACVCC